MATFTEATFTGVRRAFKSEKEAYVWLLTQMLGINRKKFESSPWFHWACKGRGRLYFAESPSKLFPRSPRLGEDRNNYEQLPNGLYANLNLSGKQKSLVLRRVAETIGIRYGTEWGWKAEGQHNPSVLTIDDL